MAFDKKEEARLRLKIDLYIIPTVFLLYLFAFIDRSNIGKVARNLEGVDIFMRDSQEMRNWQVSKKVRDKAA